MKSEILSLLYPDYTRLPLSSVSEMDPNWPTRLLEVPARELYHCKTLHPAHVPL